jgi:hypothetical protein
MPLIWNEDDAPAAGWDATKSGQRWQMPRRLGKVRDDRDPVRNVVTCGSNGFLLDAQGDSDEAA